MRCGVGPRYDAKLSTDALDVLQDWIGWCRTGTLDAEGALILMQTELAQM